MIRIWERGKDYRTTSKINVMFRSDDFIWKFKIGFDKLKFSNLNLDQISPLLLK